jgi:hypothetical protein
MMPSDNKRSVTEQIVTSFTVGVLLLLSKKILDNLWPNSTTTQDLAVKERQVAAYEKSVADQEKERNGILLGHHVTLAEFYTRELKKCVQESKDPYCMQLKTGQLQNMQDVGTLRALNTNKFESKHEPKQP